MTPGESRANGQGGRGAGEVERLKLSVAPKQSGSWRPIHPAVAVPAHGRLLRERVIRDPSLSVPEDVRTYFHTTCSYAFWANQDIRV